MGKSRRAVRLAAGKHGGGHRASPPSFPPPPPPGSSSADIANWLGDGGVILVLFETPSGFALLDYNGTDLFRSRALEKTWVDFTTKKGETIDRLVKMIRSHHRSSQKLAVGKSDYKTIIEAKLNLMKSLVPAETCELNMEERCPMSKGKQMILSKHGFSVEPEIVDEDLIAIATALYESDYSVNRFAAYLHLCGKYLWEVSGIDYQNWDLQKIATALKLLSYPKEKIGTGTSNEMLSADMASTLVDQSHMYEDKLHKVTCLNIYKDIMFARAVRSRALVSLKAKGPCAIGTQ